MENKEQEQQKPQTARQPVEAVNTAKMQHEEEGVSPMPPEETDNKVVTRHSRYVTYFTERDANANELSPTENADQESGMLNNFAEEVDAVDTQMKEEVPTEQTVQALEETSAEAKEAEARNGESPKGKNAAEEKALQKFTEILIEHLEKVEVGDWTRPWIFGRNLKWPQNLDGREYANSNALMLLMHTQQKGYMVPVYATLERYNRLNYAEGSRKPLTDDEGNPLPRVMVNKGAQHMPVTKTVYYPVHKDTKQRIPFAQYLQLTQNEKKDYNLYPRNFVYQVFNIDQTNLKEARPQLYEQLTKGVEKKFVEMKPEEDMSFPAVDAMVEKNLWQCPINVDYNPTASYLIDKDIIKMPLKDQFKYPEGYYGTLFHECAHSTGAKHRFDRDLGEYNSKKYAREELVAELTAALVASRYGLMKHVKSDSIPYMKHWLNSLKQEPNFLKQILKDVRLASMQIINRVDVIQRRVEELRNLGVPEPIKHPNFIPLDPINYQPTEDPLRYYAKDNGEAENQTKEDQPEQERPSFGRGRR